MEVQVMGVKGLLEWFDYNAVLGLMDREVDRYAAEHFKKFNEEFVIN